MRNQIILTTKQMLHSIEKIKLVIVDEEIDDIELFQAAFSEG